MPIELYFCFLNISKREGNVDTQQCYCYVSSEDVDELFSCPLSFKQEDDFPPRDDFSDVDQLRVGNDGIFMLAFFSEWICCLCTKPPYSSVSWQAQIASFTERTGPFQSEQGNLTKVCLDENVSKQLKVFSMDSPQGGNSHSLKTTWSLPPIGMEVGKVKVSQLSDSLAAFIWPQNVSLSMYRRTSNLWYTEQWLTQQKC